MADKPKRKRRTKAEIEAAKAEYEKYKAQKIAEKKSTKKKEE